MSWVLLSQSKVTMKSVTCHNPIQFEFFQGFFSLTIVFFCIKATFTSQRTFDKGLVPSSISGFVPHWYLSWQHFVFLNLFFLLLFFLKDILSVILIRVRCYDKILVNQFCSLLQMFNPKGKQEQRIVYKKASSVPSW